MKKIFIAIAFCSFAYGVSAQEALWSGRDKIVSPRIFEDNHVTFTIAAPFAHQVVLRGDFLPGGSTQMDKVGEGLWVYTTDEPLAPELYTYTYMVDGMVCTDPGNVYSVRDIASVSSMFIVGNEAEGYDYSVHDVPHGTLSKIWYASKTYSQDRRLSVYTPAGYESSQEHYPVLYLLHGMGGDEESWCDLGRATQILDNLIAAGKVRPMIVVMPNGNASKQAAPGQSAEGMIPPTPVAASLGDVTFEDSFGEVVDFIDTTYRTLPDKESRAIAGLSMGGKQSMKISALYPDMFSAIGLFSAAVMRDGYNPVKEADTADLLRNQFQKGTSLYWIAIGSDDFLYGENKEFREWLDAQKLPYTYTESKGGHIWRNWRTYLRSFLPLLFRK